MKINNTAKRIFCLLLAVCLLFCGFAHVLHTPADAVAVTATASVIALAVALFGWLGISFASVDAATKTTEEFVGIHPDALTFLMAHMASAGPGGGGTNPNLPGKAVLGVAITAQLVKFLTDAKNFFNAKGEGTIDVVDSNIQSYDGALVTVNALSLSAEQLYSFSPYSSSTITILNKNGVEYKYSVFSHSANGFELRMNDSIVKDVFSGTISSGQVSLFMPFPSYAAYLNCKCKYGFYLYTNNDLTYLVPYIVMIGTHPDSGNLYYKSNTITCIPHGAFPLSSPNLSDVKTPVPYNSSSLYDNQSILDTLTKQLEKQGSLTVDYQKTLTAIENKQDAQIKLDQQQLLTDIGIKTTLDEIKANQPKPEDDMNVPKLPSLNDKFPFCVPFDLIHLIQALSATPKSPKWEIPFKFPSFGIDESLTLDLTRYETVAEIVRITTVISFIFFLILVTRRLIKG
ncbi:MAG: hypothetical protein RR285_12960 [Acinetobacter sp.]